ncbi:serine hydrolase domain-containing protein [Brevibacterium luteolum]|uniref:serine hydrolase domain-containing protein n=1 Tax=Brevibacterium luteolum TaxID=199591 RepID=UPI00223B7F4B|nr:serine hydrolase domain-containing protein [Brevibacterium luteolum]MCT1656967.1 beta-lactamase family protein [Brevibacterium luteolum]
MSPASESGSVAEVFDRHVRASGGGMAFAVCRDGELICSLAGGHTCRGGAAAPEVWTPETMAVLFSGTKGLAAAVVGMLVDDGLIDVEAPVARYWPEFAAAGKDEVPVCQLLNHTVGLPYVDPDPAGDGDQYDNRLMASRLAAQQPLWSPGTQVAYHAITYGYLLSELVWRVTGADVGELIAERIAGPHGLDIHLGLPEELEERVAPIHQAAGYRVSTFLDDDPERRAIVDRMYAGLLLSGDRPFNTREYHAAQQAAGGGIATAESMARFYALLLADGAILSRQTREVFTRTWSEGADAINDRPVRFGLGFELADPIGTYGPVEAAFGHSGAGGGLHGAWPEHGIAFSFLTNEMQSEDVDTRVKDLLAALYAEITGGK